MRWLAGVLFLTGIAYADPGAIRFEVPAGWSNADDSEREQRHAVVLAYDPARYAEMSAKILDEPSAVNEELAASVLRGAKKGSPSATEVRHDFMDVAGRRSLRFIIDVTIRQNPYRKAFYYLPAGPKTAFIGMTAPRDEFDARLAEFDAIVRATKLPPPPPSLGSRIGWATAQMLGIGAVIGLIVLLVVRASRKPAI
jgi:hypothetical protein